MVGGYIPESLQDALQMREAYGAVPIAGGTDLMVRYRGIPGTPVEFPWPVVYISNLDELKGIVRGHDELVIKAGTELSEIEISDDVPDVLRQAVHEMAAPALRNLGTLAGNVCNASPAGDAVCVLYALGAQVELASVHGSRILPIEAFVTGPGTTVLKADELMTAVRIPDAEFTRLYYRKVGTRKANALSKLSFTGLLRTEKKRIADIRIALGAVAPVVVRSTALETSCIGMGLEAFTAYAPVLYESYAELVRPIDDQRSTAEYRKTTSLNLLQEFLKLVEEELA